MVDAKPVNILVRGHFKLSKAQEPKMRKLSYQRCHMHGSLKYAYSLYEERHCLRVGVVSRYMSNLR